MGKRRFRFGRGICVEDFEAVVEETVFRNEENGYSVLQVRVGKARTSAVGVLPSLGAGEHLLDVYKRQALARALGGGQSGLRRRERRMAYSAAVFLRAELQRGRLRARKAGAEPDGCNRPDGRVRRAARVGGGKGDS